jgi:hypothetical protein
LLAISSHQLVAHFNRNFPQPTSWIFAHPSDTMLSAMISVLHSKRPELALLRHTLMPLIACGSAGKPFALTYVSIPGSLKWGPYIPP